MPFLNIVCYKHSTIFKSPQQQAQNAKKILAFFASFTFLLSYLSSLEEQTTVNLHKWVICRSIGSHTSHNKL